MATTTTRTAAPKTETPKEAPVENLPARPRQAVNAIVPANWQEIATIASAICRAGMAPKSYLDQQGNAIPDKVAVAIMHGMEVGMTPMASLQSIAVINGMPGLYGDGMLAVVRASGLLEDIQETDEWDEKGPLKAVCRVKRKGEATWGEMTCARADAQKAGWWDKTGPWKATPHRMLQMRARGWALRDKFADVLRGLRSAEEVEDMVNVTHAGSATVAPAEPQRSDFDKGGSAAPHVADTGAAEAASTNAGADEGGGTSSPAGKDAAPQTQAEVIDGTTGEVKAGNPGFTDVEDLNEEETFDWPQHTSLVKFVEFSEHVLTQPDTSVAKARSWEEFYRKSMGDVLQRPQNTKQNKDAVAAINDLMTLYNNKVEREPGQEG